MLVVCEGQVTEVEYFEGIRDYFRSLPVDIRSCKVIGLGRDPGSLVDYTIRERDKKEKEARAQRDANIAYDEVWCVVDVDDHKTLDQALIAARKAGINLAISPLLRAVGSLSLRGVRRRLRPRVDQAEAQKHIRDYDKHLGRAFPFANHEVARDRAQRADPDHCAPNRKGRNPSTNAWLIVEVIRQSGRSR
ncbi:RloB family protein [Nonomuraea sp. NPDC050022]|uniref:RloB family protein n=1 Tax=Nonomuraea sp. NPDC050022 TaxID=3364358 RepID=UPI0037947683